MNSKIIGIGALLLAVLIGAYYLTTSSDPTLTSLNFSESASSKDSVNALNDLTESTVLSVAIDGQRFTPAREAVDRFFEKVKDLPLLASGKAIGERFQELLDEEQQVALASGKDGPKEVLEALTTFFNEFQSFQLSLMSDTFSVANLKAIPFFTGKLSFSSDHYPKLVRTMLDKGLVDPKSDSEPNLVKNEEGQYFIELPGTEESVVSISTKNNAVSISPIAGPSSASSKPKQNLNQMRAKISGQPAVSAYVAGSRLISLAKDFFEINAEQIDENQEEIFTQLIDGFAGPYQNIEEAFFSTDFENGMVSKGCAKVSSKSEMEALLTKIGSFGDTIDTNPFLSLVMDRTYFAGELSIPKVLYSSLYGMEMAQERAASLSGGVDPSGAAEKSEQMIAKLKKILDRVTEDYGLERVGIVLNPGSAGFMPDGYLYLTTHNGEINLFEKLVALLKEYAPDFDTSAITVTENGMQMPTGRGAPLVGRKIDDHRYLVSVSDFLLDNAASLLKSAGGGSAIGNALEKKIPGSQYYVFLNADSIISFAQPFAQMMIASQQQETGLTPEAASKILDQLKVRLVHTQKMLPVDQNNLWCAESSSVLLG